MKAFYLTPYTVTLTKELDLRFTNFLCEDLKQNI